MELYDPEMSGTLFEILMVITLGLLGGTCFGLLIGYLAGLHKPDWHQMTSRQKSLSCALVAVCSVACIAELAWYVLE
jgi:LytS/YehU family sensor histidine kinase